MNKSLIYILLVFLLSGLMVSVSAQTGNLSGYVFDNNGKPIEGANVILSGTTSGTATGSDGLFILQNIAYDTYGLEISFIGFKKEIINIVFNQNYSPIRITLQPNSIETEEVVVSAGKYEQNISDLTMSSAVFNSDDLSRKNILQLDEALRYVPGVNVSLNQVSIRGSSGYSKGAGTRVLVAVDGVPIYTGITGEIVWQLIPLSDVKKIEVIKGPSSSLYGQTAIGGVINIITRDTPERPITYAKTFFGTYDNPSHSEWKWSRSIRTFYGLELMHSNRIGSLGYAVSLKKYDNNGYRKNDYNNNYSGYLKLNYDFNKNNSLRFLAYYLNAEQGNFIYWKDSRNAWEPKDSELGNYTKSNRQFASLIYRHNFSQSFTGEFKSSYYRSVVDGYSSNHASFTSDFLRNEFIGTIQMNSKWIMLTGAEFAYSFIGSNVFGNPHFLTASIYAQSEYKISEALNSVVGIRNDYIFLTDVIDANAVTPRAGLNYKVFENLILRSSFATGFRAPTPAEAFIAADGKGSYTQVGNPNLDYETSVSYEFGINYKPYPSLKTDVALFNTDYENFIEPVLTNKGSVQFINLPKARIQGLELMSNFTPNPGLLELSLGYQYLWARDLDKNQFLKYRPRHTLYGSVEVSRFPFEFRIDARFMSKIEEIDFELTQPPINLIVDGNNRTNAFVVDVSVGFNTTIAENPLKVFFNAKNVFNYNYIEFIGNLAPPRNMSLSLEGYF